jgi:hypothetical protein
MGKNFRRDQSLSYVAYYHKMYLICNAHFSKRNIFKNGEIATKLERHRDCNMYRPDVNCHSFPMHIFPWGLAHIFVSPSDSDCAGISLPSNVGNDQLPVCANEFYWRSVPIISDYPGSEMHVMVGRSESSPMGIYSAEES